MIKTTIQNYSYKVVSLVFHCLQVFQVLLELMKRETELPLTDCSHFCRVCQV